MKKNTHRELEIILENHKKWLTNEGGKRANLSYAELSYANLSGANLSGANLRGANLSGANLRGATYSNIQCPGKGSRGILRS